ncbi:hypothetical protein EJB05_35456, partial [Eragrostis curvula]
ERGGEHAAGAATARARLGVATAAGERAEDARHGRDGRARGILSQRASSVRFPAPSSVLDFWWLLSPIRSSGDDELQGSRGMELQVEEAQ